MTAWRVILLVAAWQLVYPNVLKLVRRLDKWKA